MTSPRAIASLSLLLVACASGPRARVATAVDGGDLDEALEAYEALRATDGVDADVLGGVAGLLLAQEAKSDDPARRNAAVAQLSLAGTGGRPVLLALSQEEGVGPARLAALSALARRGDPAAKLALRALADHDDLAVVAASVLGMDPALDRGLLVSLLTSPSAEVRAAAAGALGPVADDTEVLRALSDAARVDPAASVRAAAVRSLADAGAGAVAALRERLSDPESMVRLSAVAALARADRDQALLSLGPLLEVAPSPAGIEAARWLAQGADDAPEAASAARAFLRRALAASEPALRSQAGVALAGLPADAASPLDAVRQALRNEADPEVRLSLARALHRHDRPAAIEALEALLSADGMPRVQAAAQLAAEDHTRAREALREVLSSDASSVLRRTAARALARDAMQPDAVRSALRDEDPMVRIYAAGGILAAAAAS